jgi:hypothetical protein
MFQSQYFFRTWFKGFRPKKTYLYIPLRMVMNIVSMNMNNDH